MEIGLRSLRWLVERQKADAGHFAPVGSNGFWTRGNGCARFDQQPLEAYALIAACVEAYSLTHDLTWQRAARRWFEWFLGRNDLGQSLYDSSMGGCRDALHAIMRRYENRSTMMTSNRPIEEWGKLLSDNPRV